MKRSIIVSVMAAAVLFLAAGCDLFKVVRGSGFLITRSYEFSGFSKIEADETFTVHIVPDTAYSVQVTCDDNLLEYLEVSQEYDKVRLSLQPFINYRNITLSAEVHMPMLSGLVVSGASLAKIDSGFAAPSQPLSVNVSGASTVQAAQISCGALSMDVSGASDVSVTALGAASLSADVSGASTLTMGGSIGGETLHVSGASGANLLACLASGANAYISGASKAWVNVGSGPISASVSGASTLYYTGSPAIIVMELSGESHIVKVN